MPYLKPEGPMQNRSNHLSGYMYQLHISWHFFTNLSNLGKKRCSVYTSLSYSIYCSSSLRFIVLTEYVQYRSERFSGNFQ